METFFRLHRRALWMTLGIAFALLLLVVLPNVLLFTSSTTPGVLGGTR